MIVTSQFLELALFKGQSGNTDVSGSLFCLQRNSKYDFKSDGTHQHQMFLACADLPDLPDLLQSGSGNDLII